MLTVSHTIFVSWKVSCVFCFRSVHPQRLLEGWPDPGGNARQRDLRGHGPRPGQTGSADARSQWGRTVGTRPPPQTAGRRHRERRPLRQVGLTHRHHQAADQLSLTLTCLSVCLAGYGVSLTTLCWLAVTWRSPSAVFPSTTMDLNLLWAWRTDPSLCCVSGDLRVLLLRVNWFIHPCFYCDDKP